MLNVKRDRFIEAQLAGKTGCEREVLIMEHYKTKTDVHVILRDSNVGTRQIAHQPLPLDQGVKIVTSVAPQAADAPSRPCESLQELRAKDKQAHRPGKKRDIAKEAARACSNHPELSLFALATSLRS
jgi:hypothetical protein